MSSGELYYAADRGDVNAVKRLLASGADPNKGDFVGRNTPLVAAVIHGDLEIVKMLLDKGADPNIPIRKALESSTPVSTYEFSASPTYWAIDKQRPDILRYLLMRGAKIPLLKPSDVDGLIEHRAIAYRSDAEAAALRKELRNLVMSAMQKQTTLPPPVPSPTPSDRISRSWNPASLKSTETRTPQTPIIPAIPASLFVPSGRPTQAQRKAAERRRTVKRAGRKMSRAYCRKTVCARMGFSQKASCRPYKNCY